MADKRGAPDAHTRITGDGGTIGENGDHDRTTVCFGRGLARCLSRDVARLAGSRARVFLVADPFLEGSGALADIERGLGDHAGEVVRHIVVPGEPKGRDVDAAVERARACGAGVVVAAGGGSALDLAKLVAALAPEGGAVESYALAARPFPESRLPIIAVPTTAGTGAEVTRTCIFATETGVKAWAWSDTLRPDVAVLDPELSLSLPRRLTVATGVDALVHAIEATTNRNSVPGSDLPAMAAIGLVRTYLPRAAADPDDIAARGAMLRAASLAGVAIDRAGTGVAHALGHAVGSLAPVHHGHAVGVGLRAAIGWNAVAAPDSHAAVAHAFGVKAVEGESDEAAAHALAAAFEGFLCEVGLPASFDDEGLSPRDAERVALAAMRPENATMLASNCRSVGEGDVMTLCRAMFAAA